jgi:hypothetical protein
MTAMPTGISLYDVLGVSAGASADTLGRARAERLAQLRPGLESGAPSPVAAAAARAREAVDAAGRVLGDPALRLRYDQQIGLYRARGLRGSPGFAEGGTADPYALVRAGVSLLDGNLPDSVAAFDEWLAPRPAARGRRRVVVPDLRGLFSRPCHALAAQAGFRLAVIHLTRDPLPVEGLVTGQEPAPGSAAGRRPTLTIEVWHPARTLPRGTTNGRRPWRAGTMTVPGGRTDDGSHTAGHSTEGAA